MAIVIVSSRWHLMEDMKWNMRVIWIYCCHVGKYIVHAIMAFLLLSSPSCLFWYQKENKRDKKGKRIESNIECLLEYYSMDRGNCEPVRVSWYSTSSNKSIYRRKVAHFYENLSKISRVPDRWEGTTWRNVRGRILHSVLVSGSATEY